MKITFIRDKLNLDRGGANWSLHLLAEELTERGYEVEVLTVHHSDKPNIVDDHSYQITERPINNHTQIDGAVQIYRLLDKLEKPGILHSFQPQLHPIVGAWKKQNPETPIVGRLNSYRNFCTNPTQIEDRCYERCTLRKKWRHHPDPSVGHLPKISFDTYLQPNLLNQFDVIHAQSPAVEEIFVGYGIDSERVKVVPNFYEQRFGDPFPDTEIAHTDQYRVLYVGRIEREKGLEQLLEAVELATSDMQVDIVGDGSQLPTLKQKADDSITFHGWIDHGRLPRYYRRADVLVHPSMWPDPCPRSILEAMQFRCVPVVSDTGGPPWMVGDGGVVVPREDAEALAKRLDELSDRTLREEYQQKLETELSRFEPERIIGLVESTYRELAR